MPTVALLVCGRYNDSMIHVGTCAWTEKSLIQSKEFYPKNVRTAESRLQFYSGCFDTVEVDSTYYAIPPKSNAFLWAQRSSANFVFHIKVYGAIYYYYEKSVNDILSV